jgi:hypothetical protein
MPENYRM